MGKARKRDSDQLSYLSSLNVFGRQIPVHRSIERIKLSVVNIIVVVFVPILFNIVLIWQSGRLAIIWKLFFEFWIQRLDKVVASVIIRSIDFFGVQVMFPAFLISTDYPGQLVLLVTLFVTLCIQLITYRISLNWAPLIYWLRLLVLVQLSAIFFFAYWPDRFPYTTAEYLDGLSLTGVVFLFLLPWVHALVYYIFNFQIWKKICLTIISSVFLVIAVPFEIMTHAYVLERFSIIMMPVLYFLLGIFPLILACIALYGWAMSWKRIDHAAIPQTHSESEN